MLKEFAPYGNMRDFLKAQHPQHNFSSGYEMPLHSPAMGGNQERKPLTYKDLVSFSLPGCSGDGVSRFKEGETGRVINQTIMNKLAISIMHHYF